MTTYKKIILLFGLAFYQNYISANNPVLIMTTAYNRPDFIQIQYKTFKKFLHDDYEFIVFNDAPSQSMCDAINKTCNELGLRCIRIPQEIHTYAYLKRCPGETFNNSCVRCANVVQYALNNFGIQYPGIVMLIDSDMFLVKPFNIKNYLNESNIAGVPQSRINSDNQIVEYIWNGLVFFNMETLPNKNNIDFNCGKVLGVSVDVGGHMYHYLKDNSNVTFKKIIHYWVSIIFCDTCKKNNAEYCTHNTQELFNTYKMNSLTLEFIQTGVKNIEFLIDSSFLHYRGGGNWDNQSASFHEIKTKQLNQYIDKLLN